MSHFIRQAICRSARSALIAVILAAGFAATSPATAADDAYCHGCKPREYWQPDLFYSFYVPGNCGGIPADMYPAPVPTPPLVGHTYYTYQPLMPHEFLYRHKRSYHHYYNYGRGLNRTRVVWW